jgi:mRNA-degrading endonuclease toxin of MazEF toxin-antitoxin module
MFWLSDRAIEFAEERGRIPHETRRCCVIVEGTPSLGRADSPKVLVVPTSSRVDLKGPFDVLIPHPPAPSTDVMVRIEHVQPVLRDDLEDYVQRLKPDVVDEIMASLASFLDLI